MLSDCEFEEKTFEAAANGELFKTNVFAPGQVLEGHLGIDAAGFTMNSRFWRTPKFLEFRPWWRPGVLPHLGLWEGLTDDELNKCFPPFKCNLFLQYKRPEYVEKGDEYKDWGEPYYRYRINTKQQSILQKLENELGDNSLVLYSSPAFWQYETFWAHQQKGRVIDNTNFTKPSFLAKHSKYTYINARSNGKAYSNPEEIKVINFKEELGQLLNKNEYTGNNSDFTYSLAVKLKELLPILDAAYGSTTNQIVKETQWGYNSLSKHLAIINLFTYTIGLTWLIATDYDL